MDPLMDDRARLCPPPNKGRQPESHVADGIYNAVVSNHSCNVENRAAPSPSERGHHRHHWHGQRKNGEKQGGTGNAGRPAKDNRIKKGQVNYWVNY